MCYLAHAVHLVDIPSSPKSCPAYLNTEVTDLLTWLDDKADIAEDVLVAVVVRIAVFEADVPELDFAALDPPLRFVSG